MGASPLPVFFILFRSFNKTERKEKKTYQNPKKARDWYRISRRWERLNKHTHMPADCRQSPATPPFIYPDTNAPQAGCIWSAWDSLATYAASVWQLQHVLRLLSLCPWTINTFLSFHLGLLDPKNPYSGSLLQNKNKTPVKQPVAWNQLRFLPLVRSCNRAELRAGKSLSEVMVKGCSHAFSSALAPSDC